MRIGSTPLVTVLLLFFCFEVGAAEVEVVQNVEYSIEHGFYDAPFQLTLSTPTPAAEIRYMLDGSTPKSIPASSIEALLQSAVRLSSGPQLLRRTMRIQASLRKPIFLSATLLDNRPTDRPRVPAGRQGVLTARPSITAWIRTSLTIPDGPA